MLTKYLAASSATMKDAQLCRIFPVITMAHVVFRHAKQKVRKVMILN